MFLTKCRLATLLLCATASHATSFDPGLEGEPPNVRCAALVKVDGVEYFDDVKFSMRIYSVYSSQVIFSLDCSGLNVGDRLYFAAPGGDKGEHATRVNGIEIEVGQEATIFLSENTNSLGVPILLRSFTTKPALPKQTPLFECARAATQGPSLFWRNRTVTMHPSISNDPKLAQEVLVGAMKWAGDQWSSSNASDLRFVLGEPVTQRWVGYDWSHNKPNYNLVTVRKSKEGDFYSEWLHASRTIALTSITYIRSSGEIVDADIELNAEKFTFTDCPIDSSTCITLYDLKNTLTHEYGHVLGLNHPSADRNGSHHTTMFAESMKGETAKRILSEDDKFGLNFLYPAGKEAGNCFEAERKATQNLRITQDSGCAQTQGSSWPVLLLALTCLIASLSRDRKRC